MLTSLCESLKTAERDLLRGLFPQIEKLLSETPQYQFDAFDEFSKTAVYVALLRLCQQMQDGKRGYTYFWTATAQGTKVDDIGIVVTYLCVLRACEDYEGTLKWHDFLVRKPLQHPDHIEMNESVINATAQTLFMSPQWHSVAWRIMDDVIRCRLRVMDHTLSIILKVRCMRVACFAQRALTRALLARSLA